MKQADSLLIPIKLRASLVGKMPEKSIYSDFSYDFTQLGDPNAMIEKPLFTEKPRLAPGVYLHWSLPGCFTQGFQDEKTKEITYRLAPNRWAVIRMWRACSSPEGEGDVHGRAFLVESDILSREPTGFASGSPSWPLTSDQEQPYRFLGRSFPMEQEPEAAESHIRLTAVSPVSPFFAAYAPACTNVFSFYDDLAAEGLAHAELSYLVCGWYQENGEPEPIRQAKDWDELLQGFGLTGNSPELPSRALCHGLLDQILWETEHTLYHSGIPDDPMPGETVEMPASAIGNNAAEALSALLAVGHGGEAERLMTILLQSLEKDLDRRQGIIKAEEELHHTKFSAEQASAVTGIRKLAAKDGEPPPKPLTDEYISRLAAFRQKQRRAHQNYAMLLQKQRSIYENWYLHLYAEEPYNEAYSRATALSIEAAAIGLHSLALEMDLLHRERKSLEPEEGYELIDERDEPFYLPTEPSLLISQKLPSDTLSSDEGNAPLFCRVSGQTVTALRLSGIAGLSVTLEGSSICPRLHLSSRIPEDICSDILSLAAEAVLLSVSFSGLLAELAFQASGKKPSGEELLLLRSQIQAAQESGQRTSPLFLGTLPEPLALNRHRPQWYPLILEWQADYYPDLKILSQKPDFSRWSLTAGDYVYTCTQKPDPVIRPENAYPVQNRLFISDHSQRQAEALIKRRFQQNSALAAEALQVIRRENRLSQTLDGFNGILTMREPALPPAFYLEDPEEQQFLDSLRTLDGSVLGDRPIFDQLFSPIRAGFFSLSRLRIIDALGRFQDISRPDIYAPESLRAPGAQNPIRHLMVPPRLLQPSRLAAWFLTAGKKEPQEAFFLEAASPICGFVLPNLLDHSLAVYDKDGLPAGTLNLVQTGQGIRWESPPGQPRSHDLPEGLDPELHAFLAKLMKAGPKALQDLVEYINLLQPNTQSPGHSPARIEFIGKPVAVARLAVRLELLGAPEPYRHYLGENEPDPTGKTNICLAGFPLIVGNPNNPADGTLGFFEDGDYRHFHICPEFLPPDPNDYFVPEHQTVLHPDPKAPPKILTLLLDPWAEVTLTTGILPVRTMALPNGLADRALQAMEVTFFCSPILTGNGPVSIPVPHSDSIDFYWEAQNGAGAWDTELISFEDDYARTPGEPIHVADGYIQIRKKREEENHDKPQ